LKQCLINFETNSAALDIEINEDALFCEPFRIADGEYRFVAGDSQDSGKIILTRRRDK
jgi:hypothetical protein